MLKLFRNVLPAYRFNIIVELDYSLLRHKVQEVIYTAVYGLVDGLGGYGGSKKEKGKEEKEC
ncbi:MAG: hypothetical protein ACYC6P_14755 [Ignavibacteriaceae bacterium]